LRSFESERAAEIWIIECINIPISKSVIFGSVPTGLNRIQKLIRDFVLENTEL
jgi:hypothetical protein